VLGIFAREEVRKRGRGEEEIQHGHGVDTLYLQI